jgi:hypothetical protein
MKKITQIICLSLLLLSNIHAQQEKGIFGTRNWLNTWTEFKPSTVEYGEPTQILTGTITKDTKLYKRNTYLLLGSVFVTDSTTLTIEPGTVILGDFKTNGSLVISKGSQIIAVGSETDPIVFTSNKTVKKQGDWGGLFILGDAPINKFGNGASIDFGLRPASFKDVSYGGANPEDTSGILRYVRIEFAGKRTKNYGYFNALTIAGVGHNTIFENVMVSHSQGNSFNVLGGEVNLRKTISYKTRGNDYMFSQGTQSDIINSVAIRSPYISGSSRSRCVYIKTNDDNEDADLSKKGSLVTAENLTMVNISNDLAADMQVGLVKEAIYIAKNASLHISTSVISGFNPAVILDSKIKINSENLDNLRFSEMYFNNCNGNIFSANNSNNDDLENWYGNRAFDNVYAKSPDAETFINLNDSKRPDFRLRINKIIASSDFDYDDD